MKQFARPEGTRNIDFPLVHIMRGGFLENLNKEKEKKNI